MESQNSLEINNANIHYYHHEINPERPTLIFLHDSLGSTQLWRDFPKEVAEKRIVIYLSTIEKVMEDRRLLPLIIAN